MEIAIVLIVGVIVIIALVLLAGANRDRAYDALLSNQTMSSSTRQRAEQRQPIGGRQLRQQVPPVEMGRRSGDLLPALVGTAAGLWLVNGLMNNDGAAIGAAYDAGFTDGQIADMQADLADLDAAGAFDSDFDPSMGDYTFDPGGFDFDTGGMDIDVGGMDVDVGGFDIGGFDI